MNVLTGIAIGLFVVAILIPFIRLLKGPTVFDRLLSIGAIGGKTILLILLLGLAFNRMEMFVDIAIAYALLNFISGLIVAEYFRLKEGERR